MKYGDDRDKAYPQYENDASLAVERLVADEVAEKWKCDFFKLPKAWELDFCVTRAREEGKRPLVQAWAEVKGREKYDWAFFERNGFMISTKKIAAAKALQAVSGLPFICIVKVSDGIFWRSFKVESDYLNATFFVAGRADKRDPWEPVSNYNANSFKRL